MKKSLQSQYALQNNQYLKTVSKTTDALTNHQWDDKYKLAEKQKKEKNNNNYNYTKKNDDKNQDGKSLTQTTEAVRNDITCFCCGEKGHFSNHCKKSSTTPQENWVIKIDESLGKKDGKSTKKVNWSGTQIKGTNTCQVHRGINLQQLHRNQEPTILKKVNFNDCLLYTSDAADE